MSLKDAIKDYAYRLGADLVGIGDIGRCRNAPPMMSPQGLYPDARSVIVMALHHPDACIELGGEEHPQAIGPYSVQYLMNSRLDEMSYRMATFVERQGHGAVPIVSSNIWRYNEYKDLNAVFAPDVSHIYMAVVAGLADLGYNGLALSPEYGARNRFITVITDAELESDPLIPPGTVCDRCMLCRKHCPAEALSKEIDGEKVLAIGEYEYRFPNKNLWRCSWGEHFDLDLDLELPEVVDEQVILDTVARHGVRSGEMGQCLKFCVPKPLRTFEPGYSRTPMRRYEPPAPVASESRATDDRLLAEMLRRGADEVIVATGDELRQRGMDLECVLPGAQTAVTLVVKDGAAGQSREFRTGADYHVSSLCFDLTRRLEELGYRSLMTVGREDARITAGKGGNATAGVLELVTGYEADGVCANTVVTRKPMKSEHRQGGVGAARIDHGDATADITGYLCELARSYGADVVGVTPAARIEELADQLRPVFESRPVLDATDESIRFTPWDPRVSEREQKVMTAEDWLPGAKSALVFGLRLHRETVRQATRPPAEAVGPYSFLTFETWFLGMVAGYRLVRDLEQSGYRGVIVSDLMGTASLAATPRGPVPDLFANRFAGLAAGLGTLSVSGHLTTPQFGIRQRVIAVVTDASLTASALPSLPAQAAACAECDEPCVKSCPSRAFGSQEVRVNCEGREYAFREVDRLRCDWSKRYALTGASGFQFLGSPANVAVPETVTGEALAAALKSHDAIKKYRPVVAEPCVINCPLAVDGA